MQIKAKQVREINVDIEDTEIIMSTIRLLENKHNIEDKWIEDGWLCCSDEYGHGTPGTLKIRKVSSLEENAFKIIELLKTEFMIYR